VIAHPGFPELENQNGTKRDKIKKRQLETQRFAKEKGGALYRFPFALPRC
jgi:hypothetical protein